MRQDVPICTCAMRMMPLPPVMTARSDPCNRRPRQPRDEAGDAVHIRNGHPRDHEEEQDGATDAVDPPDEVVRSIRRAEAVGRMAVRRVTRRVRSVTAQASATSTRTGRRQAAS